MAFEFKRRPPRQPLSPEEVLNFIYRKKIRQQQILERFKKSRTYKVLNAVNIVCIVIYSEIIFCFLGPCHFHGHYIQSINAYYTKQTIGGKRVCGSALVNSYSNKVYDINFQDTITLPKPMTRFVIGSDWLLQKEVKSRFESIDKYYYVMQAFPLMLVSVLMGSVTFVLFGYNLNQNRYSLQVMSFINAFTVISFLLL
jgi:hypothetical protein